MSTPGTELHTSTQALKTHGSAVSTPGTALHTGTQALKTHGRAVSTPGNALHTGTENSWMAVQYRHLALTESTCTEW